MNNFKKMKDFDFEIELTVRDYECDIQGIVNNANYQHYLEHCRHQFMMQVGDSFSKLHDDGIDAVVVKAELNYKYPLRPGDVFLVRVKMGIQGSIKIIFDQQVIRKSDMKLCVDARVTGVLTKNGRPQRPDALMEGFKKAGVTFNVIEG